MYFNRRDFMKSGSALLALGFLYDNTISFGATLVKPKVESAFRFSEAGEVQLKGFFGTAYEKGLKRLEEKPIDLNFILADVNFNQKRNFTNFSGDISGRFIEVCSLTSPQGKPRPNVLKDVLNTIIQYQKKDGHYGVEVDWSKPIDFGSMTDRSVETPILWGNGRIFLGLLAAYERFNDLNALASAERMGDFYINVVIPRFCDPNRMEEYKKTTKGYAAAYVTCVYHGIEGLVRCYRLTGKKKYLDAAVFMANFHEPFDVLPVGHSHGSISTHEALLLLYENTADKKYLDRIISRWQEVVKEGYVNPCGSVLEKFVVTGYNRDEGCSEADWLRLNLMLYRNTGETKYLNFAERLLYNGYPANQWPSGGFGHRELGIDEKGPYSWKKRVAEAFWCCCYHGPLGLYEFKEFLAVCRKNKDPNQETILYNFPVDFVSGPIKCNGKNWTLTSKVLPGSASVPVRARLAFTADDSAASANLALRVPEWADDLDVQSNGKKLKGKIQNGYWLCSEKIQSGAKIEIDWLGAPYFEDRRFHRIPVPQKDTDLKEVVLRFGPDVYVNKKSDGKKIEDLNLQIKNGKIVIPETMSCFSKMTEEERAQCHTFVFNVKVTL